MESDSYYYPRHHRLSRTEKFIHFFRGTSRVMGATGEPIKSDPPPSVVLPDISLSMDKTLNRIEEASKAVNRTKQQEE